MIEELFNQIKKAREEYTDVVAQETFDRWEKEIQESGTKLSALQAEIVVKGLKDWSAKVGANKRLLANKAELSEQERSSLFSENKVYQEVINYFTNPKENIDYIRSELKKL